MPTVAGFRAGETLVPADWQMEARGTTGRAVTRVVVTRGRHDPLGKALLSNGSSYSPPTQIRCL